MLVCSFAYLGFFVCHLIRTYYTLMNMEPSFFTGLALDICFDFFTFIMAAAIGFSFTLPRLQKAFTPFWNLASSSPNDDLGRISIEAKPVQGGL